ncbi:MAG: bifunctional serine/threonine-protein kinase/formylglycine-generating enzyme family protein [Anaerolineaceae bacterium]
MTTLGKYELHEQLGRGGFGTVYRAVDTSLGREVALKVLHPQLTTAPDFLERFREEARLAASVENPHIVTIHECDEQDGRVFIAMRYLPGGSLKQRLEKDGPIRFLEALEIIKQVCGGLQAAHEQGLVHRDIKPANILFDKGGQAVVGDFGLARAVQLSSSSADSSKGGAGTPAYRAPELWRGDPPASPATDIYSLGCVLFEMLTGRVLFDGVTPDAVLTQHLIDGPRMPSSFSDKIPNGFHQVLKKALEKDLNKRYQTVRDFETALAGLLEKSIPTEKQTTKNQVYWGILAILGVVVIAINFILPRTPSSQITTSTSTLVITPTAIITNKAQGTITPTLEPEPAMTPEPTSTSIPAFSPTPDLTIGSTFVSPVDGMEMLYVPAGEFEMGSSDRFENERPTHNVILSAFWIDKYEVTNKQYNKCVDSGICRQSYCQEGHFSDENQPVVCVDWEASKEYCEWVERRLPTEAEWEKAAKGTDGRIYPWGNRVPGFSYANWAVSKDGYDFIAPIGSFPDGASPFGVMDLAGNVWEWTADLYGLYSSDRVENPIGASTGMFHVLRGGSWNTSDPQHLRTTVRLWESMNLFNAGFRCALTK